MSKIVCISGCSRGLGYAMVKEFSNRGWKVAGGARTKGSLQELKKELNTEHFLYPLDVTIPESVDTFAEKVEQSLGAPDLLINNAGLINKNAPLTQITPEEFSAVLTVNLGGVHNMIRAFVPIMEKKGEGLLLISVLTGGNPRLLKSALIVQASGVWRGSLARLPRNYLKVSQP